MGDSHHAPSAAPLGHLAFFATLSIAVEAMRAGSARYRQARRVHPLGRRSLVDAGRGRRRSCRAARRRRRRASGSASASLADACTSRRSSRSSGFVVYIATAAIAIGLSVRLDSTALTVIGGALAFAVGFAMRDLVAAFIAGITIMFDRPFQVGDRVSYAGEYGDIIKIGLRSVRMNTLDHNIVTIPNNKVLTDVTSSGNYGALEMQVPMDFYIGIDQDVRARRGASSARLA